MPRQATPGHGARRPPLHAALDHHACPCRSEPNRPTRSMPDHHAEPPLAAPSRSQNPTSFSYLRIAKRILRRGSLSSSSKKSKGKTPLNLPSSPSFEPQPRAPPAAQKNPKPKNLTQNHPSPGRNTPLAIDYSSISPPQPKAQPLISLHRQNFNARHPSPKPLPFPNQSSPFQQKPSVPPLPWVGHPPADLCGSTVSMPNPVVAHHRLFNLAHRRTCRVYCCRCEIPSA